jgi:uncharacterized protein
MKKILTVFAVTATLTLAAHAAAPLNCARAYTPTERTVCHTSTLLQADSRMTTYFEIATQFVGMGARGSLYDQQQAFPALRDQCATDKACILAAYGKQTAPLEAIIANVKSHGPF